MWGKGKISREGGEETGVFQGLMSLLIQKDVRACACIPAPLVNTSFI